jgi:hypothetical protein
MLLIPAAAVVVVGVAFGLAGSGLLSGLRPVGNALVTSLEWTTRPFVPGAHVVALTAIGDRLIATGSLNDQAAAWYSDDGGETWTASNVAPARRDPNGALAGMTHALGKVAERDGVLVALDAYSSASASLGSIASPDENVRTLAWTSHNNGATWAANDGIQGGAVVLTATPQGFGAFGMDTTRGFVREWTSTDGAAWIETEVNGIDANSMLADAASDGSQLFLTGFAPSMEQTPGKSVPMIWQSSDGRQWTGARLGPASSGIPQQVAVGPRGPVVVGGTISAGSQDASQRPVVWMESGDNTWNETFLPADSSDARVAAATNVASNALGTLAGVRRFATDNSPTDQLWFIPSADPDLMGEQGLRRQIAAVAALANSFVVLSQCDPNGECNAPTVSVGIPNDSAPTESPTSSAPTPSEIPVGGVRESIIRQNLAAARNGFRGGLLEPGWLPDSFVLVGAEYSQQGSEIDSVDLRYEAGPHYLHIWQTDASPEQLGEKDPVAKAEPMPGTQWNRHPLSAEQVGRDGVVEYSRRLDDGRTVSIDSDLDQDTMRHVLDSVYLHIPTESPPATRSPQPSLAPTRPPLSRDAAIEAARAFAGIGDDTPVASAQFGPFGLFEPDPNQKNSPPPPDHLVWRVIFGSTDAPTRGVILDYFSGALIELGAAVSDFASPLTRDEAIAAARNAAGASNDVKSARLGPYQDLHLTPLTSQPAAPLSQLVWRIDFDYRYPDGSFQVVIVEAYSGQLIETTGVVN